MTDTKPPQAIDWRASGGQAWADLLPVMERGFKPIGDAVSDLAHLVEGERVLDIGCGGGATTLDIAQRIGPGGWAVGVDISPPLLDLARQAAQARGLPNVNFREADAETCPFEPQDFDALVSRFGVMFFDDAKAAFINLRRALAPTGRLAFACWRSPAENPFAGLANQAAAPLLPPMGSPPKNAPGRFGFADPDYVSVVLTDAGWRDIVIGAFDSAMPGTLDEVVEQNLRLGPIGVALRDQSAETHLQVREAVAAAFRSHVGPDGMIPVNAACWLVTARP